MPFRILLCTIVLLFVATGCAGLSDRQLLANSGGSAALFNQFQAFDGRTGRRIAFPDAVQRCREADAVLFGEEHSNFVCNQIEAQLLATLAQDGRPVALAMEFFERDTQTALNGYLDGELDEIAFREQARQNAAYWLSHRPLIEFCRAAHVEVLAANAPRRFLRQFRESGKDYDVFRAELLPADQRLLPRQYAYVGGEYRRRFLEVTKNHPPVSGPAASTQPVAASRQTSPTSQAATPSERPTIAAPVPGIQSQLAADSTETKGDVSGQSDLQSTSEIAQSEVKPIEQDADETSKPDADESLKPEDEGDRAGPAGESDSANAEEALITDNRGPSAAFPEPFRPRQESGRPQVHVAADARERGYLAQLLWDNSMAETLADFRWDHSDRRVMLVVGSFHVANEGGTQVEFRRRRPHDRVCTIIFRGTDATPFAFNDEDRNAGDIVIYGLTPPEKP